MSAILGVQTHFSFHWGVSSPAAWFTRAEALGYEYIGIADHASLCGLPEIVNVAAKSRVTPLYGASFPLGNGNIVFAFIETRIGYSNLCQFITDWITTAAQRFSIKKKLKIPLLSLKET